MSYKLIIEEDRCKGCSICVEICPQNVLEIASTGNSIGYFPAYLAQPDGCTYCKFCCVMCPDVAITIHKKD